MLLVPTFLLAQSSTSSQPDSSANQVLAARQDSILHTKEVLSILSDIEKALGTNSAEPITKHFCNKVHLNLRGKANGYYSGNQAHYIFKQYFEKSKFSQIHCSSNFTERNELYCSGNGFMLVRGKQVAIKVYIGFIHTNGSYQISQFTIY